MGLIRSEKSNDILTVFLSGHIDTSNASAVEAEIGQARKQAGAAGLILDAQDLAYISSAGLRVILRLRKAVPDLKILNVSPEVWEILEMTGFTEMMEVRKAFRRLSVEGCEVIGQGANGMVYRIDPEIIVKAYRNPDALPEIKRERELARAAFVKGIPTAIPFDVVRLQDGGYGSVFELLNAESYARLLISGKKSVEELAVMSVELLRLMHGTKSAPGELPDMKAVALGWVEFLKDYLPEAEGEKLCRLVKEVPEVSNVLHGDYHIKNIMYQNGESLLIDMDTLCCGHPIFELASMFNAYVGFSEVQHRADCDFLGISNETAREFWERSLRLYLGEAADEEKVRSVEEKAALIGYARMMRRRIRRGGLESEEGRREIDTCRERILEILPRVDTLTF